MQNQTAYKYYKLTCIATNDSSDNWDIYGFKLYSINTSNGKHHLYKLIPKLSSNSQDGYEATASSVWTNDSGHQPFYAFDGASNTKWASDGTGTQWLQIKFPTATISNVAKIISRTDGNYNNQAPKDFEIQGSNDGETWTTLTSQTDVSWSSQGQIQTFEYENETAYLYYRLFITANSGESDDYSLGEFIIERKIHEYKRYLNKYEYLVPILTGQTTVTEEGSYVVTANPCTTTVEIHHPFDRTTKNIYEFPNQATSGWIQIQLPTAKTANILQVGARWDGCSGDTPRNYTLYGSNDAQTWNKLFSVENSAAWSASELRQHEFENEIAYRYYRLSVANPSLRQYCSVARFDLFHKYIISEY